MSAVAPSVQVIGYGNPGRQDDGLGPMFVDALRKSGYALSLSDPYQLTVEDALSFTDETVVVFVDAAKQLSKPFEFAEAKPSTEHGLGSHTLSPQSLLQLSETIFGVRPTAYVLAIKGEQFDDFEESLSPQAQQNLDQALDFFRKWLSKNAALREANEASNEVGHA